MESGFKKLWSRKKSFGSVDRPSHSRKVSSSNGFNVQSQSTTSGMRDGRPSMASSHRQLDHQDRTGGSRDITSITSDDLSRTKSGHRIQPMLVGISRPDTGKERPDTAGSFQNAVQRAADSVVRRPSDVLHRPPISTKNSQVSQASSRHVDIFSVAAARPSFSSRYNEEIAERNLDTYRLVLENTPYVYNPSSKYQEEVAIRNAYLPYRTRASTDTSRRSLDHDRTTSMTSRSVHSGISPQPNGVHGHKTSIDSTASGEKSSHDQAAYHIRQSSGRSRDGTQLPSIPQEYADEGGPSSDEVPRNSTQVSYSPARSAGTNNIARDTRMQTITEGHPYELRPLTGTSSCTQRDSGYTSGNAFIDYKLSAAEQGNRSFINRPVSNDRSDLRTSNDVLFGPPSVRSTTSSTRQKILLPNRTIMDLTNDDVEHLSETSSSFGYFQYSPVLEQAKFDAFQRVQPSQIRTEDRYGSKEPGESVVRTASTQSVDSVISEDVATPTANSYHELATTHLQKDTGPSLSSAFSPISTVASWSPRSSAYITNPPEHMSMTARVTAALEASKAITKENPLPVPSRTGNETPTVRERVATFESNVDRGISPTTASAAETALNGVQTETASVSQSSPPPQHIVQAAGNSTIKTPAAKTSGQVPHTPSIYTSPESITSVDYVNPSTTFGVRTRDFALSPRESTPSSRKKTIPGASISSQPTPNALKVQPKIRTTQARAKTTTPATSKLKNSGFDEEAFARKQAEARAALERLQRSLSEDFITLPDRSTLKSAKGKEVEVSVRPVAPTIVLPQEPKVNLPNTSAQRAEIEKPPPSSFRTSKEYQQRSSMASNRSLSAGSRTSRRAPAPSSLKNVEPATNPIDQKVLSPALLQAMQTSSRPPKSPGEISLSSFPVPSSSRPSSQPDAPAGYHSHTNSIVGAMKRRSSTKSQGSTTSGFSIPYHMVPGRTSSVRDPVPEEVDPIWG